MLMDYSNRRRFTQLTVNYRPIIEEVIKEKELQILFDDETNLNFLRKKDAIKFNFE